MARLNQEKLKAWREGLKPGDEYFVVIPHISAIPVCRKAVFRDYRVYLDFGFQSCFVPMKRIYPTRLIALTETTKQHKENYENEQEELTKEIAREKRREKQKTYKKSLTWYE